MASPAIRILKNCLVWVLCLILLPVPLLVLWLWRTGVVVTARILRPKLVPFTAADLMSVGDRLYKRPLINVGLVLVVPGRLDLGQLRSEFSRTLLDPKDSANQPINANLFRFLVRYGGYCFKERVTLMNLENLIYEARLGERETFSDFVSRFFYGPYREGEPLWGLAVLQGIDMRGGRGLEGSEVTTLLFRLHHSMGDGNSLVYLFDKLTANGSAPSRMAGFKESFCEKISMIAGAPARVHEFVQAVSARPNPFPMSGINTEILHAFFTLDLESVKRVRRRTGAHVICILLTLLGGVLRRLLMDQRGQKEAELPEHIYTAHTLPWPAHSRDQMCNQFTVGIFKVPIKNGNGLERLRETERDFNAFQAKGIHKLLKRLLLPIASLIPVQVFDKSDDADLLMSTSWPAIVGGSNYELLGRPVRNVYPFLGITSPKMTMIAISFSHSKQIDVTMAVNKELVSDESTLAKVTTVVVQKELQSLITLSEALS